MKKILVIDDRRALSDDLTLQLLVDGITDFQTYAYNPQSSNDLKEHISGHQFAFALIEHHMLQEKCTKSDFGKIRLYGYCSSDTEPVLFDQQHIPYMGKANRTTEIIKIIRDILNNRTPETPEADNEPIETNGVPEKSVSEADATPEQKLVSNPIEETTPTKGTQLRVSQIRLEEEEYQVQQMLKTGNPGTQTIAIYSAKGGVGKTTLAANIAMYLSLIAHGRSTYRVCLVDYNVDFGDIRSTLGFPENGPDMTDWAEDIHQQLLRGRRVSDITYSTEQVNSYLQSCSKGNLSVLLAPLLHENALTIESDEMRIMLSNIIRYGNFDFVVCDTGNNTRDGSYCALEAADTILLLCTQDATTATCNDSALRALKKTGLDLRKVHLVINNIVSSRQTGISCDEIEEAFQEYECVAKIRHADDITRANNYSHPLVFKPNHAFTSDLRQVIRFITHDRSSENTRKKRRFKR